MVPLSMYSSAMAPHLPVIMLVIVPALAVMDGATGRMNMAADRESAVKILNSFLPHRLVLAGIEVSLLKIKKYFSQ